MPTSNSPRSSAWNIERGGTLSGYVNANANRNGQRSSSEKGIAGKAIEPIKTS